MGDLAKIYDEFVVMLIFAEADELNHFKKHLDKIQDGDFGPGGELARAMEEHVDFVIEERKRA